jgi:hypothetical protein
MYENSDLTDGRKIEVQRHLAFHRIEYNPNEKITFGFSESVIYSYRSFELTYVIPLPYHSLQGYRGDFDNILLFLDFNHRIFNNFSYYGVLLLDEFAILLAFEEDNRNWIGYQLGFKLDDFIINSLIEFEYTWTDQRIYRHRMPANDYYSYNIPIGFWGGPHAEEYKFVYSQVINEYNFIADFSFLKRGLLTDEMLINQYEDGYIAKRYKDNISEEKYFIQLKLIKNKLYENIDLSIGLDYLKWKNVNLNPYLNDIIDINELENIEKIAFSIDFKYNF